jgi:hypothetical protein
MITSKSCAGVATILVGSRQIAAADGLEKLSPILRPGSTFVRRNRLWRMPLAVIIVAGGIGRDMV